MENPVVALAESPPFADLLGHRLQGIADKSGGG